MIRLLRTLKVVLFVVLAGCGSEDVWQPAGFVDYAVMDGDVAGVEVQGATEGAAYTTRGAMHRVQLHGVAPKGSASLSFYWRGDDWDMSGDVVYFSAAESDTSFDAAGGARFFALQEGQTLRQVNAATLFAHYASGPDDEAFQYSPATRYVAVRFIECQECGAGEGRTIVEVAAWGHGVFAQPRAVTSSFLLAR